MGNINEIEVVPKSITIGCKLIQVSVIIMAIKYAVISINLGKSFKELLMAMSISVASLVFVAIIAIYISKRKYIARIVFVIYFIISSIILLGGGFSGFRFNFVQTLDVLQYLNQLIALIYLFREESSIWLKPAIKDAA